MHIRAKKKPFDLIRGGLENSSRNAPLGLKRELIGVATVKRPDELKDITSYMMSINPLFRYLVGQTIGVFDQGTVKPSSLDKQKCFLVRWPSLSESSQHAIWVPQAWLSCLTELPLDGPFDGSEQRQRDLLSCCLLSDRIFLIAEAMDKLPFAPIQGIDREKVQAWQQAALDWLTSGAADNSCEVCGEEIPRFVYEESETAFVGPIRQRCHEHFSV